MGIFFTYPRPNQNILTEASKKSPPGDPTSQFKTDQRVPHNSMQLSHFLEPTLNRGRFVGALTIATVLLLGAIWTGQHNLPDISNKLMDSFSGFSGIVLGLLGGEVQKS